MTTLSDFTSRSLSVADLRGLAENNPIAITVKNGDDDYIVVVSPVEVGHSIFPLNVMWLVSDDASPDYQKILRRSSREASGSYDNTWTQVLSYEDMFSELQHYDNLGNFIPGELPPETYAVPASGTEVFGGARLSVEPVDLNDPIAAGDNDPRLSDDRMPVSHVHEEVPAEQLGDATHNVNIAGSNAPAVGDAIVAVGDGTAAWRGLTSNDIHVSYTVEVRGPTSLNETDSADYRMVRVFGDGTEQNQNGGWAVDGVGTLAFGDWGDLYVAQVDADTQITVTGRYNDEHGVLQYLPITVDVTNIADSVFFIVCPPAPPGSSLLRTFRAYKDIGGTLTNVTASCDWSSSDEILLKMAPTGGISTKGYALTGTVTVPTVVDVVAEHGGDTVSKQITIMPQS